LTRSTLNHLTVVMLLVVLSVFAPGCGADSVPEPRSSVDRNLWNTAWDEASESQRVALRDGELTFAEYETAALRAVQCIDDAGMQGEANLEPKSRTYAIGARWQSSGDRESDEKKSAEADACYAEHWNGINQAWAAQNQPSEQELYDARQALAQCLRDAGLDVPAPATSEDLLAFRESGAYFACAQQAAEEYGIPNFGG